MQEDSYLPKRLGRAQRERVRTILDNSEVALISCLFWRLDIRRVIAPRRLGDSYLYFPVEGRLCYRIDQTEGTIGPGEFMMVSEGVEHEARLAEGCEYFEAFAIHAHAYTAHSMPLFSIFRDPIGRLEAPQLWFEQLELLTHLMGHNQELGRRFGEPWLRRLLLHQVMRGSPMHEAPSIADPRLWRSLRDIMADYASSLTVRDLARRAGLSEARFRTLFRQYTGQTPKAYIQTFRLRKARALLQTNPLLTVKEVAKQTGFGDAHYLHAVFKQAYGVTPGACRRRGRRRR